MKCKECGTKIENNASFCPNCGASINKDYLKIFQKGWFWLLIAILIVVILAIIINNAFFGKINGVYQCQYIVGTENVRKPFSLYLDKNNNYTIAVHNLGTSDGKYEFTNNKIYFSDSLSLNVLRKFGKKLYSDVMVCYKE